MKLYLNLIIKGQNLNYGDGIGNERSLKKVTTLDGTHTFVSKQALKYDIKRILKEDYGYSLAPVTGKQDVVQYCSDASIRDHIDLDLFGYMKTAKKKVGVTVTRKGVARVSDAISMEEFDGDMEFNTNKGLVDRGENLKGSIFNSEIHKSLYNYDVLIDLDKVGVDFDVTKDPETKNVTRTLFTIDKKEKARRVIALLETIKNLNRDVAGHVSNLSPIFVIGGMYQSGNPFLSDLVKIEYNEDTNKIKLNEDTINEILSYTDMDKTRKENTNIGMLGNTFETSLKHIKVEKFFNDLKEKVNKYYK